MMKITVCFLIWAGVQVVASQSDYEGNGLSEDEFGHYMGWKVSTYNRQKGCVVRE